MLVGSALLPAVTIEEVAVAALPSVRSIADLHVGKTSGGMLVIVGNHVVGDQDTRKSTHDYIIMYIIFTIGPLKKEENRRAKKINI